MTLNEYQRLSNRTLPGTHELPNYALGLNGEAGEVAELVKKGVYHGHPIEKERMAEELGDVLWYVAAMATACGMDMDQVAIKNVSKLHRRYPDGFDPERSQQRLGHEVDEVVGR